MKKTAKRTNVKNLFMETVHSAEFMVVLIAMTIASTFALTVTTSTSTDGTSTVSVVGADVTIGEKVSRTARIEAAKKQSGPIAVGQDAMNMLPAIDSTDPNALANLEADIVSACNDLRTKAEINGAPSNVELVDGQSDIGFRFYNDNIGIFFSAPNANVMPRARLCNYVANGGPFNIGGDGVDDGTSGSTDSTAGGSNGSSDGSAGGTDGQGGF